MKTKMFYESKRTEKHCQGKLRGERLILGSDYLFTIAERKILRFAQNDTRRVVILNEVKDLQSK